MITYRHIKHIFRVSEQKGIWILSYSNLGGAMLGYVLGNVLYTWFPLLPSIFWYPLGIILGVTMTFRVWGWPLYVQLYRWGRYWLYHQLRPRSYDVDTATYYSAREPDTLVVLMPRPRLPVSSIPPAPVPVTPVANTPVLQPVGKERP